MALLKVVAREIVSSGATFREEDMKLPSKPCAKPAIVAVIPAIDVFVPPCAHERGPVGQWRSLGFACLPRQARLRRDFVPDFDGIVPVSSAMVRRV